MRSQDHEIVLPVAVHAPAHNVTVSPSRRDSLEDADDSFTRKRPRLADSATSRRVMSAAPAPASSSPPTSPILPLKQPVEMTIRPPPPSSPAAAGDDGADFLIDLAASDHASPPVVLIDDEGTAFTAHMDAEDHFRQFPYSTDGNYCVMLRELALHIEKATMVDPILFTSITQWLAEIPDREADLRPFFMEKLEFWAEFAHFINAVLRRRYQLVLTSSMGQHDDLARSPLGDKFDNAPVDDVFTNFFCAYIRTCSLLLLADAHRLSQPRSKDIFPYALLCEDHIRHLYALIRCEKTTVFHLLHRMYATDTPEINLQIHKTFLSTNGSQNLLMLAEKAFHHVSPPTQNEIAKFASRSFSVLGWSIVESPIAFGYSSTSEYCHRVLDFFQRYSSDLFDLDRILDATAARELIHLFSILLFDLCRWEQSIAGELASQYLSFQDLQSPSTPPSVQETDNEDTNSYLQDSEYFPGLVTYAWKFKVLRKYVFKGKMDLRVLSIAAMDNTLVEIWKEHGSADLTRASPILQYLSDFLLRGRVVDYIVSVDSHPQLISRSGNVVGFLVVTDRWSDSQVDIVWNAVANNPDPRVVIATMTMLRAIVSLMKPHHILHLCKKLYELPIERYTLEILQFLRELTGRLTANSPQSDSTEIDHKVRPWNVCVRLIRETAPGRDVDKCLLDLHNEASDQLQGLLPIIPTQERYAMYEDCAQHIADHTIHATGSVRVIYLLTAALHSGDGTFFQEHEQLSRQILQEISVLVDSERTAEPYQCQMLVIRYRLELLAFLISTAGVVIPPDLHLEIWQNTVGPGALSNTARDVAWSQFLHAINIAPNNYFCEQLISSYVPTMDPQFFTLGLFEFVVNYRFPATQVHISTDEDELATLESPKDDLFWLLMTESSSETTIGDRAARVLAARYAQLSHPEGITLVEAEAAHVALVEKCMKEIGSACKIAREESQSANTSEVRCERILVFQKMLVEYIRQRPELNRARRADSKVDESEVPCANTLTIRYQCGNDRQFVLMDPDHTLDDLYTKLSRATGYTKMNLFAKGQRLDVVSKASQKIAEIDFGGQLLIQRAEGAEITGPCLGTAAGTSAFENALLQHFDELFELMDSEDAISQMIFDFLTFLPPRDRFTETVLSGDAQSESLFPPGKSFQARYAAHALQSGLMEQIRGSNLNERFLANAVHHLSSALLDQRLMSDPITNFQELRLAAVLVHVLMEFLRERPSSEISAAYFPDGSPIANRLVGILSVALECNEEVAFIQDLYSVILEASLHARAVWDAFMVNPDTTGIHRTLLLVDTRHLVREHIARKIASVSGGDLPSTCPITTGEIASCFWAIISDILPDTIRHPEQSQQLFEIAEHVFRTNDEYVRKESSLKMSLVCWSELLLSHRHHTFVGQEEIDFVVFGFTKLLLGCLMSLKSFKKPLNAGALMEKIFKKYIFATGVSTSDSNAVYGQILDSYTRLELYDLMLALADDKNSYDVLVELTSQVEKQEIDPVLHWISVDRSAEVRSSTGYVGLYNPRNICYMNSLLTQLFMNLNFRQFILGLEVQEAQGSQRLLFETQQLFTRMQHSIRRSTDPRDFAACVKSLEQTPIDVTVQMDVDEFYNLVFDQWEAQLVREEDKRKFRSFYGGQTLNQIKSKECDHVSERTEPFFAVQCDVQGKSNLRESLEAFVKGDVMEGDNKYKCESCGGRFVDAVKRTCLKDVPDNLIFHLKRFEFDLSDFSRRKIYDYFEFPASIDINEYHVDHLSHPSKPCEEDIFDLVGILVHSGTCESGHYYSYIRERPSPMGTATPSWVEFDDSNVGSFNPSETAQRAFGGTSEEVFNRHVKVFSAYMLFYQRRSAMEKDQQDWVAPAMGRPFKVPAPKPLVSAVEADNSAFIREYCLFDPCHSKFVRQLHAMSRTINNGTCSEDHSQETRALQIVVAHLSQIAWRQQTPNIFTEILTHLRRTILSCSICCATVLQSLITEESALFNLTLRCTHARVRSQMRALLIDCLKYLRSEDPSLYGIESTDSDMEFDTNVPAQGILVAVVGKLRLVAHDSAVCTRGWDDFYLTLNQILEMGQFETAVLLDHGFLHFCARLFSCKRMQDDAYDLSRIMSGKRRGIFNRLIAFFSALLSHTDANLPVLHLPVFVQTQSQSRFMALDRERLKFPLSAREKSILFRWDDGLKAIAMLDKALELFVPSKADHFYPGDLFKWMLSLKDHAMQVNIFKTITEGLGLDSPFCDAYARAGLSFCEACPVAEHVQRYITIVAKAVASSAQTEVDCAPNGDVVLDLFNGLLNTRNEVLFEQRNTFVLRLHLMSRSRFYAIPLLMHVMDNVRQRTQAFLYELLVAHDELSNAFLLVKWASVRQLIKDMIGRIAFERNSGMTRIYMTPLLTTCETLIQALFQLTHSDNPALEQYKDENDGDLFQQYGVEVESQLSAWPEEGTPLSTVEVFDQSDYGSESDDAQEFQD